jgi:cytoskeletal protein RodZ
MAEELKAAPDAPPPLEPAVEEDHLLTDGGDKHMARKWLQLIGYILMALIIALILVFGVRWIYRSVTHKSDTSTTSTQDQSQYPNNTTPQPGTTKTPTTTPTTAPTTTPSTSSTSTTNLPNNGPGDVVAIFLASSIAAAGLHYIISVRRVQT